MRAELHVPCEDCGAVPGQCCDPECVQKGCKKGDRIFHVYELNGVSGDITEEEREEALVNECTSRNAGQTCLKCKVTYASEYGHQQAKLKATRNRLRRAEAMLEESGIKGY